jgi:hypothetical protein
VQGRSPKYQVGCFGFACEPNFAAALNRAKIEFQRNQIVLDFYGEKNKAHPEGASPDAMSILERRLLFFGSEDGILLFKNKSVTSHLRKFVKSPELVTDIEILGPWSKYAQVWRCLFRPVSSSFLEENVRYFLF